MSFFIDWLMDLDSRGIKVLWSLVHHCLFWCMCKERNKRAFYGMKDSTLESKNIGAEVLTIWSVHQTGANTWPFQASLIYLGSLRLALLLLLYTLHILLFFSFLCFFFFLIGIYSFLFYFLSKFSFVVNIHSFIYKMYSSMFCMHWNCTSFFDRQRGKRYIKEPKKATPSTQEVYMCAPSTQKLHLKPEVPEPRNLNFHLF